MKVAQWRSQKLGNTRRWVMWLHFGPLACTFHDSLKLCSPVLFCSGLALFCKASPLFRIQDGLTLGMCQIFCRTRCWDCSPQRKVGSLEEVNAIPASVPDRMHVLQLCLLHMSSWVWANFTLANLGIGDCLEWIFGQAEKHRGKEHEHAVSRTEPLAQRGQLKLPMHLWS